MCVYEILKSNKENIFLSRDLVRLNDVLEFDYNLDDFRIERYGNCIHVLNAPSPAATASLAIGDYISQIAAEYFML